MMWAKSMQMQSINGINNKKDINTNFNATFSANYQDDNGKTSLALDNVPIKGDADAASNILLKVQNLGVCFDKAWIFRQINFDIIKGQVVCMLGHSGGGKSTMLQCIAGFMHAHEGDIWLDGDKVVRPSMHAGVVFQQYALLPWLNAGDNIALALQARYMQADKAYIDAQVDSYLGMVGLLDKKHMAVSRLSGGMKQRIGIARAFALAPKLLLLDEPFGALDALTRTSLQSQLQQMVQGSKQTVFMITHDIDEALLLADTILVLHKGLHTLANPARQMCHADAHALILQMLG